LNPERFKEGDGIRQGIAAAKLEGCSWARKLAVAFLI